MRMVWLTSHCATTQFALADVPVMVLLVGVVGVLQLLVVALVADALQPAVLVAVTTYVPAALTVIVCVVAALLQE